MQRRRQALSSIRTAGLLAWAATGVVAFGLVPSIDRSAASPAHGPLKDLDVRSVELASGVTVLIQRIPGAAVVAVEEIYPVGLIHDPAGVTQGTHFIEHLRCMGATESFPAGEAFQRLNTIGLANAETMGDLTHYDLVVEPDQLGFALSIVAERLESLRIDAATMHQEAPRCYAEVEAVTRATGGPGLKFALAAATQYWRSGLGRATLLSGLGEWDPAPVAAFISRTHRPEGLLIVVAGDLDPAEVEDLARLHLGELPDVPLVAGEPESPLAPIRFLDLASDAEVAWDVNASAVFVGYPPPDDPDERLVMTLWSMAVAPGLAAPLADSMLTPVTNSTAYPVGELPVFAFSGVPEGGDDREAATRLAQAIESLASSPGHGVAQARSTCGWLLRSIEEGMDPTALQAARTSLRNRVGPTQAERLIVGNVALQTGLIWHAAGPDPGTRLRALLDRDPAWWEAVIRRTVSRERRFITRLVGQ